MSQPAEHILVAEDHMAMAGVIRFALSKAGFQVSVARNGPAAWELLQQQEFDLVVSDFQMPGLNGGQLRERMRDDPKLSKIPFMLLTAKGFELDEDYYRDELGVREIVGKPFSPRALVQMVEKTLESEAEVTVLP